MIEPGILVLLVDGVGNSVEYPAAYESRSIVLTGSLSFLRSGAALDGKPIYHLAGYEWLFHPDGHQPVPIRHVNKFKVLDDTADAEC